MTCLLLIILNFIFVSVCHVYGYPQRPEEDIGCLGFGVKGNYELPDVGTGNRT